MDGGRRYAEGGGAAIVVVIGVAGIDEGAGTEDVDGTRILGTPDAEGASGCIAIATVYRQCQPTEIDVILTYSLDVPGNSSLRSEAAKAMRFVVFKPALSGAIALLIIASWSIRILE